MEVLRAQKKPFAVEIKKKIFRFVPEGRRDNSPAIDCREV
jgi:hypothetical protein